MKRILALIFAMALLLSLAARGEGEKAREITVMIYLCGSNLETNYGSASADIEEMLSSGIDARNVNVVVMTGGARYWHNGQDPDQVLISRVRGSQLLTEWSGPDRSMGDADTLRFFIDYAVENHPAKKYALILWNHGGGPMEGLCWDEKHDSDNLTLEEMTSALRDGPFAKEKLEWVGFDACLMGSAEVALQLAPYARYMICSEETEPADGWDYGFLTGLSQDADGGATGRRVVDAYMAHRAEGPVTLSCIDLSRMEDVRLSVDKLFALWMDKVNEGTYSDIAKQRKALLGYGMDVGRSMRDHDLIDLQHLVATLTADGAQTGEGVRRSVEDAVVYQASNIADSCGLTLYFPFYNKELYDKVWRDAYAGVKVGDSYAKFIQSFGEILLGAPLADWSDLRLAVHRTGLRGGLTSNFRITTMDMLEQDITYDADILTDADRASVDEGVLGKVLLSAEQQAAFASARLMVLERMNTLYTAQSRYRVVYTSPALSMDDDGAVRAAYRDQTLHVLDADGESLAAEISYNTLDNGEIAVHMLARSAYRGADAEEQRVIMTFRDDGAGDLTRTGIYIYDALLDSYERRAAYDAEKYPYVAFPARYVTLDSGVDAVDWAGDGHYGRESVIRYSDDWHLGFRTTSDTRTLVMCMEITDTQNERHLTNLRSGSFGTQSRDLLEDFEYMRVSAEDMLIGPGRVDMNLTFTVSEDSDQDVYVYGAMVNGARVGFIREEGPSEFDRIHLDAGGTVTRTLSLDTGELDAVEEVSLVFALYYDATVVSGRELEGGHHVFSPGGGVEGMRWGLFSPCKLRPREPVPVSDPPALLTGGDLQILRGALYHESNRPELDSASPLDPRLEGTLAVRHIVAELPPEAAGCAVAVLVSGVRTDGGLRLRQVSEERPDSSGRVEFLCADADVALVCGEGTIPLTLYIARDTDGMPRVNILQRVFIDSGESTHMLQNVELGADGVRQLMWYGAERQVELSESVSVNECLCPDGDSFGLVAREMVTLDIDMLPLKLRCDEPEAGDMRAYYLDESGAVLAQGPVEILDEWATGLEAVTETEVAWVTPDGQYVRPTYQTEDWIGWLDADGGICVGGYIGEGDSPTVPDEMGGLPVRDVYKDTFNGAHIEDLTAPETAVYLEKDMFRDAARIRRGTLTTGARLEDMYFDLDRYEELTTALENWGFQHVVAADAEIVWEGPLFYRRLPSGDWEVMACNHFVEDVTVPARIGAGRVVSVGDGAFRRNALNFIRTVDIAEGVERIGARAFGNSTLTAVTLPASLKSISPDAFEECGFLMDVRVNCDADVLPEGLFDSCPLLRRAPYGLVLRADAKDEQVERLSRALGLGADDPPLARAGEPRPDGTPAEDVSFFMGRWVCAGGYFADDIPLGDTPSPLIFNITFSENGAFSGSYVANLISGRWAPLGDALLTEDFVFVPGDDGTMTCYANHARLICVRAD